MIELLIFAVLLVLFAVLNLIRLLKGPSAADRMVASDTMDMLVCCAMILFALWSGRGIYLDISIIAALFGIIDTSVIGRYLDRGRWHDGSENID